MKKTVFAISLVLYLLIWNLQIGSPQWNAHYLSPPAPAPMLQIVTGYGKHLAGFALFVKTSIFTGNPAHDNSRYAENLALNFDVMTRLYPDFIDPYYLAQSSLAHISSTYAERANGILLRGSLALPENLALPFFAGFNYFHYLNQPKEAAEIFFELAGRPGAPSWYGHLASVLAGQGGNLYVGLMSLHAMCEIEEDELQRERFRRSIEIFEEAISVFEATQAYNADYGHPPEHLHALVPSYLSSIPELDGGFELIWDPPIVRLERSNLR